MIKSALKSEAWTLANITFMYSRKSLVSAVTFFSNLFFMRHFGAKFFRYSAMVYLYFLNFKLPNVEKWIKYARTFAFLAL